MVAVTGALFLSGEIGVQPGEGTALDEIIKKIETVFIGVYSGKTRGNRHKRNKGS